MKRKAIIVDIDGTLSNHEWRRHFYQQPGTNVKTDWDEVQRQSEFDMPNEWCRNLVVRYYCDGYKILFVTGRNNRYRESTDNWLKKHLPGVDYELHMRYDDDRLEDSTVKRVIYDQSIAPRFAVEFVVDDRQSVVDMWRSIPLVCLQCAKGDY